MYFCFISETLIKDKKIKKFIFNLFSSLILVLLFMFIFGYFETSVFSVVSRGYGVFGLDLLGIIDPQTNSSNTNWSLFINNIKGTSIEGFSYFGLGVIILLLTSIILYLTQLLKKEKNLKTTLSNNIGFSLIIIFLTCWAITTNVYFKGEEIFNLPLHNYIFGMLSIFGATGRFIWPVYYLIIILSLIYFYKNFSKRKMSIALTIILIIQIVDIFPGLKNYFVQKNHINKPEILKDAIWNQIPKDYENFRTTYLFNNYGPIFTSLKHFLGTKKIKKTDLVLAAGMDRAKAARARYKFNQSIFNKTLPNDTAYVIDNLGHLKLMKYFLKDTNIGFFFRDEIWLALPNQKAKMTDHDKKKLSKIKFNEIKTNNNYYFNFEERDKLLGVGWSHNHGNSGVWSEGEISFVLFSFRPAEYKNLKLKLNFEPYNSNKSENFSVKIFLNEKLKKEIQLNKLKENSEIVIDIKNNELKKENVIMFKFNNLISPLEIFESPDARKLGILLKSMKFETS